MPLWKAVCGSYPKYRIGLEPFYLFLFIAFEFSTCVKTGRSLRGVTFFPLFTLSLALFVTSLEHYFVALLTFSILFTTFLFSSSGSIDFGYK
jgi:hypothetical protein